MNTRITRSACAALLALASFSANAIETFFGEDLVAGSASAARPNSLAAHDSFLTRVGTARTENFDTQALGNAAGLTWVPPAQPRCRAPRMSRMPQQMAGSVDSPFPAANTFEPHRVSPSPFLSPKRRLAFMQPMWVISMAS